jgi:hypothetical protein
MMDEGVLRCTPILASDPATRIWYRRSFVDQLQWLTVLEPTRASVVEARIADVMGAQARRSSTGCRRRKPSWERSSLPVFMELLLPSNLGSKEFS